MVSISSEPGAPVRIAPISVPVAPLPKPLSVAPGAERVSARDERVFARDERESQRATWLGQLATCESCEAEDRGARLGLEEDRGEDREMLLRRSGIRLKDSLPEGGEGEDRGPGRIGTL